MILLLIISAYAVIKVVERSEQPHDGDWWRRNEITFVMSLISFVFPMLFELVGLMEYYHPRMQLRLQLARIMILNLLNLYSLIWALFGKISGMLSRMEVILSELGNKTAAAAAEILTTTPKNVQTTSMETPLTTKLFSMATSTIRSITESISTTITEAVNQTLKTTTEFAHNDSSENYDYNNPDYFEVENSTTSAYSTTTSSFNDSDIFYDDYGNLTTNFTSNFTGDLFANYNLSNLITNLITSTPNFDNVEYYDDNDSFGYNLTDSSQNQLVQNQLIEHDAPDFRMSLNQANESVQLELRKLCWESMFGQGKVISGIFNVESANDWK